MILSMLSHIVCVCVCVCVSEALFHEGLSTLMAPVLISRGSFLKSISISTGLSSVLMLLSEHQALLLLLAEC